MLILRTWSILTQLNTRVTFCLDGTFQLLLYVKFHVIVTSSPDAVILKCVLTYVKMLMFANYSTHLSNIYFENMFVRLPKIVCKIHRSVGRIADPTTDPVQTSVISWI